MRNETDSVFRRESSIVVALAAGRHTPREFDGIICLGGEDWWYHNRGHFDFQIMRRLARHWPVLFVNSLGVRMPSLKDNRVFAQRIARKLKSLARGLVNVENKFWVLTPLSAPGAAAELFAGWALAPQIRHAATRAGITRPLLWVHCPAGVAVIDALDPVAVVLQRTDRFEAFPEGDPALLRRQIDELKARADLVVYASSDLLEEERYDVEASALVTHGVDFDVFAAAGRNRNIGPVELQVLPRPRVGFIGGIDAHTFDPALFLQVAGRMPDVTFALVGGCSLGEGWCKLENVHHLGRKPYDLVARYMAAMDVLIMPWNRSEWIKACNPIKLKEYLATGRPVVSTDFPALDPFRDLVRVADDAPSFVEAIRAALAHTTDANAQHERVREESWDAKADDVHRALSLVGLSFRHAPEASRPAA